MAEMMTLEKPRIRPVLRRSFVGGPYFAGWECTRPGYAARGWGTTPVGAYFNWLRKTTWIVVYRNAPELIDTRMV